MGQRLMRRAPKYVCGFLDRHGHARFYFRRRGYARVTLPGLPWSPTFMAAYEAARRNPPLPIGAGAVVPGSLRHLAALWFGSQAYKNLKPITRSTYRNIAERFCRETTQDGRPYGDLQAAALQRGHIVKLMQRRAAKPDSANGLRKVLRSLMRHAVEIEMRRDDPTRDVKSLKGRPGGYHPWSEEEIAQFEARHPIGTRARLAFALLLHSGQRRSDAVRMGRQHVKDGCLYVRQQKTGVELWIPVHAGLAEVIARTPSDHLTFLTTSFGKPFTAAGFGNWFRDRCDEAGLDHCSAHGLRKAASRRLAECGCTTHEIASITGHASLKEVERYTKSADRKRLAATAMAKAGANPRGG